jgi:hypothetical protein
MLKKSSEKLVSKVEANKEDKASVYSLNQIQKRAIERFADKKSKFYTFCLLNGIVETDLQFNKILTFGTERELNTFKQQPDKTWIKGDKKNHFSFWLFQNCLIRYVASKQVKTATKKAEPKKTTAKVQTTVKTVKIEQKQATKPNQSTKVAKVA